MKLRFIVSKLKGARSFLRHTREKVFHEASIKRQIDKEYSEMRKAGLNKKSDRRKKSENENSNRDISAI